MSSREIAEMTGKLHKDVMKAIRNMEDAWERVNGRKFSLVEYTDSTGRKLPIAKYTVNYYYLFNYPYENKKGKYLYIR